MIKSSIVRRLFKEAAAQGKTDRFLSTGLRYSRPAIHYWRTGRSQPSIIAVELLAEQLGYELKLEKRR